MLKAEIDASIHDVSDTALWVAVFRAQESERSDALFKDPYAGRLTGDRGRKIAKSMSSSPYTGWAVVIRTTIIDSFIEKLIAEGVDTIVNLGAGLDTRPYRMNLPDSLQWIEVDYPHMVQLKEDKLGKEKPKCKLERVGLDLADVDARKKLLTRINNVSKKIVVLTEGVTPYLTEEQVASLGADLRAQTNFRYWITDYFSPEVFRYMKRNRKQQQQMKNAPFQFNPKNWFEFFARLGWKDKEICYLAEQSEKLGRKMPAPWWVKLLMPFLRMGKDHPSKKFTAYVLLERKA